MQKTKQKLKFFSDRKYLKSQINFVLMISGLRGEGEDVGARASKAERSLRQQTEGQSTEELKNGTGSHKSNVSGKFNHKIKLNCIRYIP